MKKLILGLVIAFLMLGCTSPKNDNIVASKGAMPSNVSQNSNLPTIAIQSSPIPTCTPPDLSFGDFSLPPRYLYGNEFAIEAEVLFDKGTCNGVPEYSSLTFNFGENKYEQPIGRLDSKNQVMLTFDPKKTRSYRLEFTIGYPLETENKRNNFKTADANVEPFGFTEDLAADTFLEVTGENALAESFVFEYPLEVKKFGLYLRKGRNQTYGNSSVILEVWKVVELRKQDGPILTMTSNILSLKDEWNWVNFRPPKPLTIESGIYELVIKTNSESPISVHISKDPKNTYLHNAKKSLDDPSNPYFFGAHYEGPFNFRITNDP